MDDWLWIVIVVIGALVVLGLVLLAVRSARRRRHTARLRARFGPEYETAVHRFGRAQGERHLEELLARHDTRRVRDVSDDERDAALRSIEAVQTSFVDSPVTAVRHADRLVFDVLRERGYPLDTLDARASALAVEEPELAHRYREAQGVLVAADRSEAGGRDVGRLRDAFVTYRDLLRELVGAPEVSGRLIAAPPEPAQYAPASDASDSQPPSEAQPGMPRPTHTETRTNPEEGAPWTSTPIDRTS